MYDQWPFYSIQAGRAVGLVLVGTDSLASLLGGGLDGLLGPENSSDTGKSSLDVSVFIEQRDRC